MEASLLSRFDAMEARRVALVDRVRALPEAQRKAGDKKSFSPAELIEHLGISDGVTLKRIQKNPPSALKGKKTKPTFFYRKIVADMKAVKAMPAPPDMKPKGVLGLEESAKVWSEAHAGLRKYFEELEGPNSPVLKFWLLGTLSGSDLLNLLEAHLHYHESRFSIA